MCMHAMGWSRACVCVPVGIQGDPTPHTRVDDGALASLGA